MKKIINLLDNHVIKNTKSNTLKMKINKIDKTISNTTLIHINQYNTDKQNLERKVRDDNEKNTRQ